MKLPLANLCSFGSAWMASRTADPSTAIRAGPLLDCWQYHIREGSEVVIVTYGCHVLSSDPPVVSNEHKQAGLFTPGQVPELVMPDGYKRSVAAWAARLNEQPVP